MYLTKNIIKEQIQLKKTFVASCFVFKPGVLHFHNTHLNGTISGKNSQLMLALVSLFVSKMHG